MILCIVGLENEILSYFWPFFLNEFPQIFNDLFQDLLRIQARQATANFLTHSLHTVCFRWCARISIQTSVALQKTRDSKASCFQQGYIQPTLRNRSSQPQLSRYQADISNICEQYFRVGGVVVRKLKKVFFGGYGANYESL